MPSERPEALVARLARELEPARRIPRLRSAGAGVLAAWCAAAAAGLVVKGVRPDLVDALVMSRGFEAVFAGLALVAAGGITAALALGVPGRDVLVRGALGLALAGMGLAAGVGTLLVLRSAAGEAESPIAADAACLRTAGLVAILPALAAMAFVGRAAAFRPVAAVLAAALGTAALGAIVTQLSCPIAGARHVITAHALAPAAGALVLSLPLLWVLRRVQRLA